MSLFVMLIEPTGTNRNILTQNLFWKHLTTNNNTTKHLTTFNNNKTVPQIHHLLHQCEGPMFQLSRGGTTSTKCQTETGLDNTILLQELAILSYPSQITKQDHQKYHGHGFGAYIKDWFPGGSDPKMRTLVFRICSSVWHLPTVPPSLSPCIVLRMTEL